MSLTTLHHPSYPWREALMQHFEVDFLWRLQVYWEDTDAGGIVFYANYLKFFERARTEWLRHLGIAQQALRQETGGMFVVDNTELHYYRPAQLDDILLISAKLCEQSRASLTIAQKAWRISGDDPHQWSLLCEGHIRVIWVQGSAQTSLRPARMPHQVLDAFKK